MVMIYFLTRTEPRALLDSSLRGMMLNSFDEKNRHNRRRRPCLLSGYSLSEI